MVNLTAFDDVFGFALAWNGGAALGIGIHRKLQQS